MTFAVLAIDGVNRPKALNSALAYLEGRWDQVGGSKSLAEAWPDNATHLRNVCIRSHGPFGFLKIYFECKDRYILDKISDPENLEFLQQHSCKLPYVCGKESTHEVLKGAGYFSERRNIRTHIFTGDEETFQPRADRYPGIGHLIVETTPVDRVLDLSLLANEFRSSGLSIRQHDGALRRDGKYKYAFRVMRSGKGEGVAISDHDRQVIESGIRRALDLPADDKSVDVLTDIRDPARSFQNIWDAYGVRGSSQLDHRGFLYVFAQAEDWDGELADLAEFHAKYRNQLGEARSIVRSSCRVFANITTVLMCMIPTADDVVDPERFDNVYRDLQSTNFAGKIYAQFVCGSNLGPWSMPSVRYVGDHFFAVRATKRHNFGDLKMLFKSLCHSFGGNVDVLECDSWCGKHYSATSPPKSAVQFCVRMSSHEVTTRIRNLLSSHMNSLGWKSVVVVPLKLC